MGKLVLFFYLLFCTYIVNLIPGSRKKEFGYHNRFYFVVFKGIIRPFELEEIYVFYYLIDAGEFSYSNDMH